MFICTELYTSTVCKLNHCTHTHTLTLATIAQEQDDSILREEIAKVLLVCHTCM